MDHSKLNQLFGLVLLFLALCLVTAPRKPPPEPLQEQLPSRGRDGDRGRVRSESPSRRSGPEAMLARMPESDHWRSGGQGWRYPQDVFFDPHGPMDRHGSIGRDSSDAHEHHFVHNPMQSGSSVDESEEHGDGTLERQLVDEDDTAIVILQKSNICSILCLSKPKLISGYYDPELRRCRCGYLAPQEKERFSFEVIAFKYPIRFGPTTEDDCTYSCKYVENKFYEIGVPNPSDLTSCTCYYGQRASDDRIDESQVTTTKRVRIRKIKIMKDIVVKLAY